MAKIYIVAASEEEFNVSHLTPCTVNSICKGDSFRFLGWHYRVMRNFRMAFEKLSQCEISFPKNAETSYTEHRIKIQEWSLPVLYLDHSSHVSSLSERNKSEENSQNQVLVKLSIFVIYAIDLEQKIFFSLLYLLFLGCMPDFCLKMNA